MVKPIEGETMKLAAKAILTIAALAVSLPLIRNDRMSRGIQALKAERGEEALFYFRPLARLGDKNAQELVARIYALGFGGAPKDAPQALYWYRKYAGSNGSYSGGIDPAAPHALELAEEYADNEGWVEADPDERIKWLKLAADGGSKEAAAMLVRMSGNPSPKLP